jgi:ribosomal protein S18 acetylase RimI-like enzyme
MNKKEKVMLYESVMRTLSTYVRRRLRSEHSAAAMNESRDRVKWLDLTEETQKQYGRHCKALKSVRIGKNTYGWIIMKGSEFVAFIAVDKNRLVSLETSESFMRLGFATKLIRKAVSKGCDTLTVAKRNRGAVSLFYRNGFYVYSKYGDTYRMRLKDWVRKKYGPLTESIII